MHATLLIEVKVSVTTHCCELVHGFLTIQGFWQVSLMHVIWGGQSMSTLHSGSSSSIAERIRGNTCILGQILNGASFALTFYTSRITISFQRKPTRTGFSVVASCTISSQGTVSRIAKRLTFFSCKTTTRNKATFFITRTVSVLTATSFNASH